MDGMGSPKDQYMSNRLADKIDEVLNGMGDAEREFYRRSKFVRLNLGDQQETVDIPEPSG